MTSLGHKADGEAVEVRFAAHSGRSVLNFESLSRLESGVERLLSAIHTEWLVMADTTIPGRVQEAAIRLGHIAALWQGGGAGIPAALHRALRSDGMSDWPRPESDLSLLRDLQCVVHLDAEVSHR